MALGKHGRKRVVNLSFLYFLLFSPLDSTLSPRSVRLGSWFPAVDSCAVWYCFPFFINLCTTLIHICFWNRPWFMLYPGFISGAWLVFSPGFGVWHSPLVYSESEIESEFPLSSLIGCFPLLLLGSTWRNRLKSSNQRRGATAKSSPLPLADFFSSPLRLILGDTWICAIWGRWSLLSQEMLLPFNPLWMPWCSMLASSECCPHKHVNTKVLGQWVSFIFINSLNE